MSAPSSYNKADIVTVAIPVAASVYMAYKANKKKSLTVNGCWTALGVGSVIGVLGGGGTSMVQKLLSSREVTGTFTNGDTEPQQLLPFLALLNFFYTSTYLTKKGKQIKEKEIRVVSEEAYEASGNRTATQVLCNGGVAAGLALIVHACRMLKNSGFIASSSAGASVSSTSGLLSSVCSSPATCINYFATIPNTVLALALIAQIAAAQGDTWSSELGVLSKSPYAYLIVGGRQVPKGTNGGVTLLGTAAAVGAGLQLGGTLAIAQFVAKLVSGISSTTISSSPCFSVTHSALLGTAVAAAVGGSVFDSVLGQFFQESRLCVLGDGDEKCNPTTKSTAKHNSETVRVAGWNILSNHSVNLLTVFAATVATVVYYHRKS